MADCAQMAVEGGCTWIVLDGNENAEAELRESGADIAEMCREAGVMLTIENNITMARDLALHGVYLTTGHNAVQARTDFGPEAVVGCEVASAQSAVAMAKADIDYATLPASLDLAQAGVLIRSVAAAGVEFPIVAVPSADEILPEILNLYISAGYAGIYVTDGIFTDDDPVALITRIISEVKK